MGCTTPSAACGCAFPLSYPVRRAHPGAHSTPQENRERFIQKFNIRFGDDDESSDSDGSGSDSDGD